MRGVVILLYQPRRTQDCDWSCSQMLSRPPFFKKIFALGFTVWAGTAGRQTDTGRQLRDGRTVIAAVEETFLKGT